MVNLIRILLLSLTLVLTPLLLAQDKSIIDSASYRLQNQVEIFPQEKIYIQTDRSDYISGERLWFKAYLVGALSHHHAIVSRYIYVELIDPVNTVVSRVKIRPDSLGLFHGHINIDEEAAEGDYMLRAYTQYMRNVGTDYFFKKRIKIYDPSSSSVNTNIEFSFEKDKVLVDLKNNYKENQSTDSPSKIVGRINNRKEFNIKTKNYSNANFSFKVPQKDSLRVLSIAFDHNKRTYRQFFPIPVPDDDFDISFLPEGGAIPTGTNWKVAFKCIQSNELSSEVNGEIFDSNDNLIQTFSSIKNGMGFFYFQPEPHKEYYAKCTANGVTKKVKMPLPLENYTGLTCNWDKNKLHVSVKSSSSSNSNSPIYLMAHIRGNVIYNSQWDFSKESILFEKNSIPSGIIHFVLYNESFDIISERLIFSLNEEDMASVSFELNKPTYKKRDKIQAKLNIRDNQNRPLTGDVSISVIDNKDVKPDSCSNIISYLLLTSDLKGYIEQPASYFTKDKNESSSLIDLLMLTHGWRRYNIPQVIKGNITQPNIPIELSQNIEGQVTELFGSVKNGEVSLLSAYDSIYAYIATSTDNKGYFSFPSMEHRDSTLFTLKAVTSKGKDYVSIKLTNKENFPPPNHFITWEKFQNRKEDSDIKIYISKADMKYTFENGMRMINLGEITIEAKRKTKAVNSKYYSPIWTNNVITSEEIDKLHINNIKSLLLRLPGIRLLKGDVYIYDDAKPIVIINDRMFFGYDGISSEGGFSTIIKTIDDNINVKDIETIHILKGAASASLGMYGGGGAIVITSKKGKATPASKPLNVLHFKLLGYQQPVEFYSPQYRLTHERIHPDPDLRTTIYWKPDLMINEEGESKVEFYSADAETSYSVVIEGVTNEGKLVHSVQEIKISE